MASESASKMPGRATFLYLGVLVLYVNIYAVPPMTLSIIRELGIGHLQAGLLMTTFAVMYCIGNALVGYLSDRFGALRVMAAGLALGFLASLLLSVTRSFPVMVASRLLSGMAAAAMTTPCLVTLMRWFPPERRSLSVSLHLAALTLGSALVFLVTPLLLPYLSWRVLLRLYALAGAAVLAPFPFLFRQAGAEAPEAQRRTRGRLERPAVAVVALLCAVLFVTLFQIGGALTWLPPWLQERGGFSPLQIGLASMTFSLAGIPSTLLGGWLADRPGARRGPRIIAMSLVGVSISSSVLALGWLQDARWFALVVLVIVLARWGSFMAVGPLLSLVPRLAPPGGQGSLMGLVQAVTMSGSVAASFAGGLVIQLTGAYRALWALFAAALLASAAVLHPLLSRRWLTLFPGDDEAAPAR
jgi:predicted MFS family arabinose efflux permease